MDCNCTWLKRGGGHGVAALLKRRRHWLRVSFCSAFVFCCVFFGWIFFFFFKICIFISLHVPRRKPQHEQRKEQEPKRPHIKKPLNAFMLYMKEMRANVVAECTLKESAAINQILGRRVGRTSQLLLLLTLALVFLLIDWNPRDCSSTSGFKEAAQVCLSGSNYLKKHNDPSLLTYRL